MKKVIYLSIMFLMISLTISAQAPGGQITRKNTSATTPSSVKKQQGAQRHVTQKRHDTQKRAERERRERLEQDSIWTVDEIPMPHLKDASRYVSNPDTVISMDTENRINNILKKLDDVFSIESAFVIVNHVENDDVDSFALNLGNKYGVGKDKRGFVYVLAFEDRAYRISTSIGLENELTDEKCREILDKTIPDLKTGNPDAATELLAKEIYSFFEAQ